MNNNPFTPEQLTALKNTFKSTKPLKKSRPHRIKFMGEFITLNSGKTVWKRIGDAKSALNNHLGSYAMIGAFRRDETPSPVNLIMRDFFADKRYPYQHVKELILLLEKAGVVEFVPVD